MFSSYLEEQITRMRPQTSELQDDSTHIDSRHDYRVAENDPRWGNLSPFQAQYWPSQLYSSPQGTMLGSTFIMTIFIEIIVLKFVFMGVHFYVGIVCCLYILYLLFTLGYSDPGVAFAHLEKIKMHEELNLCDQKCRHGPYSPQELTRYCNKCHINTTKKTKHCSICNCCIIDYDHHCVFIGKCVGGNNMGQFQQFLGMVFGTLLYGLVSAVMQTNNVKTLS